MPATFKTFAAMAAHLQAQDVKRAQNLRRSAPLRKVKAPASGPAVAR